MSGLNGFPQYNNYPNIGMNNMFQNSPYQNQLEKYIIEQAQQRNTNQYNNTNMDFIIVGSEDEAEKYIVQKGQTIWFRHSSEPEIYVKSVSTIGEPNFGAYILQKKEKEEEKNYKEIEPKFVTENDINIFQSNIKEQMNNIDEHIKIIEQKIEKFSKREEGGKKPYNNSTQSQKVGV
jgi:hypothetical protein